MESIYKTFAPYFKAFSEPKRLAILDMLSCGELCACKLLERFQITQPTLSHHMKALSDLELVIGRKEGKWVHYSLNQKKITELQNFITYITSYKENCICKAENGELESICGCLEDLFKE